MPESYERVLDCYDRIKTACIQSNHSAMIGICREVESQEQNCSNSAEQLQMLGFKWCCLCIASQLRTRQQDYAGALQIARSIRRECDQVLMAGGPLEVLDSLDYQAEFYSLYIQGNVKWLAPGELKDNLSTPREMLHRWFDLSRRCLMQLEAENGNDMLRLRTSGQVVIQTGLRYCPEEVQPVMDTFNNIFGTRLNTELRHYLRADTERPDCYLYWSIELAKAMYSGSLSVIELDLLMKHDRDSLLGITSSLVDRAYAISAYACYLPVIAKRYCRDYHLQGTSCPVARKHQVTLNHN